MFFTTTYNQKHYTECDIALYFQTKKKNPCYWFSSFENSKIICDKFYQKSFIEEYSMHDFIKI